MTQASEAAGPAGLRVFGRREQAVAASLAIYAVLAPLATSAIAGLGGGPLPPFVGTLALAVSLLGPGLAAIVVALRGLSAISREIATRQDGEAPQAIARIFLTGGVLIYLGILGVSGTSFDRLLPLLAVDVPGILCAWLLFVHFLGWPGAARTRRVAAMLTDIAFISLFLHFGEDLAAPWVSGYLWVVFGFGFRFGLPALVTAAALGLVGFAGVFVTTPFWREAPAIAAGVGVALLVLPGYAAFVIRRLAAARAKAEAAETAKGRFLAIMSHELRTPLNTLVGIGAMFSRTPLDEEQRDMLATIDLSARTLLGLINDLLDLSQLEAGGPAPNVEGFVLHELLGGVVAILRPQAEAKGLDLTLTLDPRLPHAYRGLPLQLRQVLMNLVANAVKFTDRGRIAVAATLAGREERTIVLRLTVRDDGIGIPPEARARIFEISPQADETVARRFGGSGLGLAIAKQLVEMMGGAIALDSAPGKGSTFTIDVPLEFDPGGMIRTPDLSGRRVVIVTPDGELAATLQAKFRSWHGETQWHIDGDAALAAFGAERGAKPTLLLLDGRDNPLAALSFAHRLATLVTRLPTTVFIAPSQGSDAIAELAAAQFAAVVESPITESALASAVLGALAAEPLGGGAFVFEEAEPAMPEPSLAMPREPAPAPREMPPQRETQREAQREAAPPPPTPSPAILLREPEALPREAPPLLRETVAPPPAPTLPELPRAPIVPATQRPLRVLVADDNAANCKILKNVLEVAGHQVEVATDGEAALTALELSRFDLALLDVNMPEVSGYDVAKLYRMSHIGEWRLPIVALTTDSTSETERLCREAGMDAVLAKPVERTQLLAAVDEIYAKLTAADRQIAAAPPPPLVPPVLPPVTSAAAAAAPVVTPITAHPRFGSDAEVVDETTVEALRALGGNDFVDEIVDTFGRDAARLLDHLRQAVGRGDVRDFRELLHSLRSAAANVGGVRLCQSLTALRDVTANDLRQQGEDYIDKIESELTRLEVTLDQVMRQQRRG